MAIAVIIPEDPDHAALVRQAAEKDLIIVDLQHLVRTLRHDVVNAEAAANALVTRLKSERDDRIHELRELLARLEAGSDGSSTT